VKKRRTVVAFVVAALGGAFRPVLRYRNVLQLQKKCNSSGNEADGLQCNGMPQGGEPLKAGLKMAGGRPKKFKPEYLKIAQTMAKVGCTEYEIAEALNINRITFWRWKQENAEFCNVVAVGRDQATDRVEKALYCRAVGMKRKVQKVASFQGVHEIVEVTEEVLPDVVAAKFWLTNQKSKEWRNMPEIGDDLEAVPLAILFNRKDASNAPDEGDV